MYSISIYIVLVAAVSVMT